MKTISLCMIVKNESHVIERCINSVKNLIDYVFIVDTGSDDNTIDVIYETLTKFDIRGEVISDTWENFAKNRSFALSELRKKNFIDYALMIDADEVLNFNEDFSIEDFKSSMDKDMYDITTSMGGISYLRPQLFSNRKEFKYAGVVHEFLTGDHQTRDVVKGFWNTPIQDSNRNRSGNKFEGDVELLKKTLETEQDDWFRSRYTFYLAQSLRDLERREESLEQYLKRAEMGYWNEERFMSYYNAGHLMKQLDYSSNDIIQTYLKGHELVPTRLECLWAAIQHCRFKGLYQQGWMLSHEALKITRPSSGLFLEEWIYDYAILDEYSIVAYWSGHFEESKWACEKLLSENKIPRYHIDRIKGNLQFSLDKLK
jgi:glycosyltransferase involved in cell wall biosynthesis